MNGAHDSIVLMAHIHVHDRITILIKYLLIITLIITIKKAKLNMFLFTVMRKVI